MATVPHVRLVAKFDLGPTGAPVEHASCGLSFGPGDIGQGITDMSQSDMNDMAVAGFNAWKAYITGSSPSFLTSVHLVEVRSYHIDEQGRAQGPIGTSGVQATVKGVAGSPAHPWQVSQVVTLLGEERGAGQYGRIYLPPQAITVDPNSGLISVGDQGVHLDAAKTFIEDISDYPGLDWGWHLVNSSTTGAGKLQKVVKIQIGRVLDTQRRRRRSLQEQPTKVDVSG